MPARFEPENQSHLLKATYDDEFLARVYALRELSIDEFLRLDSKGGEYRISYESMDVYTSIAQRLKLMADSKVCALYTAAYFAQLCAFSFRRAFRALRTSASSLALFEATGFSSRRWLVTNGTATIQNTRRQTTSFRRRSMRTTMTTTISEFNRDLLRLNIIK